MQLRHLSASATAGARSLVTRSIERQMGLRTGGTIWQRELGYAYGLYRPSSWLVLFALFGALEVGEEDVFVDVGSGMGRALFVAARRPFKRVIGIERAADLNRIARDNIDRNMHRLACRNIELMTIDALDWEIPDDLTVVYLCCPFPDEVLERFVAKLFDSLDRHPRSMRLIYYYSTEQNRQVILAAGAATRISIRVPRYLRLKFEEITMIRLNPPTWAERAA